MSVLVGQVYFPKFEEKTVDGEVKTKFTFSLATRKAFIEDKEKPNLFTPCVTYQAGLAKAMNECFGKEEHHGKAIVVYGHFNDYDWYPDPEREDHDKLFQEFKIDKDTLTACGVKFAEGSATEATIMVPIKQTTRQLVLTGFEFADGSQSTPRAKSTGGTPKIKVAGQTPSEGAPAGAHGVPF